MRRRDYQPYASTVFFMIVSLPADAADTICCSMVLFILAVSDYVSSVMVNETRNSLEDEDLPASWKPA